MKWSEVRDSYPNEWLIIEALNAETDPTHHRKLVDVAVIERCPDGGAAMQSYRRIHRQFPLREFYFVHTSRETLDIREQTWVGIRSDYAVLAQG